jgi:hypothetical protein
MMKARIFIGFALVLCIAGNARAQERKPGTMGGLVLSAWGGGAAFSDLQRFSAEARWQLPTGELQSRALDRRLSAITSPVIGIALAYWWSPNWGIRTQLGYSPSRFDVSTPEDEMPRVEAQTTNPEESRFRSLGIMSVDAQLLYRLPFTPGDRVAPYALAGVGMLRYSTSGRDPLPPEAQPAFLTQSSRDKPAGVFGLGVLVPLQREHFALSFELTDHIARTPFTRSFAAQLLDGPVTVLSSQRTAPRDNRVNMTNHVSLLVGFSWLMR